MPSGLRPSDLATSALSPLALVAFGWLFGDLSGAQGIVFVLSVWAPATIWYSLFRGHGRLPAAVAAMGVAYAPATCATMDATAALSCGPYGSASISTP